METPKLPLISPKPLCAYSPEEYHEYVTGMHELRQRGSKPTKPKAPEFAQGLKLKRTKTGKVSIQHSKKVRPFKYITEAEIGALAAGYAMTKAEVWNAFKARAPKGKENWIFAKDRNEAEKILADINSNPW